MLKKARIKVLAAVAALAGVLAYALTASGAPVIPVPNPLVKVRTQSGTVIRERVIPLGGVPVPLDVDEHVLLGLLWPDVDVSVGMIAAEELPGKPLVPNIQIKRNALAVLRKAPAPPLKIDITIELEDAGNLRDLADITFGYETPEGSRIPPDFKAKLIGPVSGGFVDPLDAVVQTPGFSAPLKINAKVLTPALDATFAVGANPLPERIHFVEDPRDDGLDVLYEHDGPVQDIKLDATADLRDRASGRARHVDARIERLPRRIELHNTNTEDRTTVEYKHGSNISAPDIQANYRDTLGSGTIVTDANIKLASFPAHVTGAVGLVDKPAGAEVDSVDFEVLDGEEIESVDFVAKNYVGDPGPVPEVALGPDQYIAAATRQMPDGFARFRAAGRLLGVRGVSFERQEDHNEKVDITTDIGNGQRALRAIVDTDNRGPGGPGDDARRLKVDTTVTPLPETIHVIYDPSRDDDDDADTAATPTNLTYITPAAVDVDADALIAEALGHDGCGEIEVTCAKARIEKLPPRIDLSLPGPGATDFSVTHTGTLKPNVFAQVDRTPDVPTGRVFAEVDLDGIPQQVRGRLDVTKKDVLRAAEFHACAWDFNREPEPGCTDAQQAIDSVGFVVRDKPTRLGLPARPDTSKNFVTLLSRDPVFETKGDDLYEVAGHIDEIRNVAFRQRDLNDDGAADGTLGVQVDVGSGEAFDTAIDTAGYATDPDDEDVSIGDAKTAVKVEVRNLPETFQACIRGTKEAAPPNPDDLPDDKLLEDCDSREVLGRTGDALKTTPMSIGYRASTPTKVRARVRNEAPNGADLDGAGNPIPAVSLFDGTVNQVPAQVFAHIIAPADAEGDTPARELEVGYGGRDASGGPFAIDRVDIHKLELRRANSFCGDPRANRRATCLNGAITNIPADLNVRFDPVEERGDFAIESTEVSDPARRPSVESLHIDSVSEKPGADPVVLDSAITALTPRISGRIRRQDLEPMLPGLELAEVAISACRDSDGADRCTGDDSPYGKGIGRVKVTLANTLVPEALPTPPALPGTLAGGLTLVSRPGSAGEEGDTSIIDADIPAFRDALISRLKPGDDTKVLNSTRLHVGFGDGTDDRKIRTIVDRKTATRELFVHAELGEMPKGMGLCLRDPVAPNAIDANAGVWCEGADAARTAMQFALDESVAPDKRPDIDVKRLLLAANNRTSITHGAFTVHNLGERIDVLANRQPREDGAPRGSCTNGVNDDANDGPTPLIDAADPDCAKGTDVTVEGRKLSDGALADVAGRVDFEVQNYLNPADEAAIGPRAEKTFPWAPFDDVTIAGGHTLQPHEDEENDNPGDGINGDPGGFDYIEAVVTKEGEFWAKGSVPHIRRISAVPGPCYTDDRLRAVNRFRAAVRPEYRCVQASLAKQGKLGLAVRAQLPDSNILSIEEGRLTNLPAGDGGLQATISSQPEAATAAPLCGEPNPDIDPVRFVPEGADCRPPMVSLESNAGPGDAKPGLTARVQQGNPLVLLNLRTLQPRDKASRAARHEDRPATWPSVQEQDESQPAKLRGLRIKLGTSRNASGARIGLNLDFPRFLDIYPPVVWSCKHHAAPVPAACDEAGVDKEAGDGRESKDIFVKAVAATNHHDGTGVPFLGRAAFYQYDFDTGTELVVTDQTPPDGLIPYTTEHYTRNVVGATSITPETLNAEIEHPDNADDPFKYGMRVPGHTDVEVRLRNDYNGEWAPIVEPFKSTPDNQQYVQVDGRTNSPMSLVVRINDETKRTRETNEVVADQSINAINLPGTAGGADDFVDPSFRLRAEIREHVTVTQQVLAAAGRAFDAKQAWEIYKNLSDVKKYMKKAKFGVAGVDFGPILPSGEDVKLGWIDVHLNADPTGNGLTSTPNAARTIDVVAGPFGPSSEAEIRGFKTVQRAVSNDGDVGKGESARVTAQASTRIYDMDFGGKIGISAMGLAGAYIGLAQRMDFILSLTGANTTRTKLTQALTGIGLRHGPGDPEGTTRVDFELIASAQLQVFLKLLFWEKRIFDYKIGRVEQPLQTASCPFGIGDPGDRALVFGLPDGFPDGALRSIIPGIVGGAFALVSHILTPVSCLFTLATDPNEKLVTREHPSPGYLMTGHEMPGIEAKAAPVPTAEPLPTQTPGDVTINGPATICGEIGGDTVTLNGELTVGGPGDIDPSGAPCDGTLHVSGRNVTLNGHIHADAVASGGPGAGGPEAGAGHEGDGGAGGTGGPAGQRYPMPDDPAEDQLDDAPPSDVGSQGGPGTLGPGGKGGGEVKITAVEDIHVNGRITADGGAGASDTTADGDCGVSASGGGSGGFIHLIANRIFDAPDDSSRLFARGGAGGDAHQGGGGGGGGRIRTESVLSMGIAKSARWGDGGVRSVDCGAGDPDKKGGNGHDGGSPGSRVAGTSSTVTLDSGRGTFQKSNKVTLHARAIDNIGSLLTLWVCPTFLEPSTAEKLESVLLDPEPGKNSRQLVKSSCVSKGFTSPTHSGKDYRWDFEMTLDDGYHSFYAIAARGFNCPGVCQFQPDAPKHTTERIAVDRTPPVLLNTGNAAQGPIEGCPGPEDLPDGWDEIDREVPCVNNFVGTLVAPMEDPMSGVAKTGCGNFLVKGEWVMDCGNGEAKHLQFGHHQGLKAALMFSGDNVANTTLEPLAYWFIDTVAPAAPTIVPTQTSANINGWHQSKPDIAITGSDRVPSSGFASGALTVYADGDEIDKCGADTEGSDDNAGAPENITVTCAADDTRGQTPDEGEHTLTAIVTDRAGNPSAASAPVVTRVDHTAPTVRFVINPPGPDGKEGSGWYTSRPFIAFATADPGGSGVDPAQPGSGVQVNVDGLGWHPYDPEDDAANMLGDGEHFVCYYAVDVAGNQSAQKCTNDPGHPVGLIRVDTSAPTTGMTVNPVAPNGANSFYLSSPTVDAFGAETVPDGLPVNQTSGLDRIEYQVDNGPWTTAAPFSVGEGRHEVRVRAFDNAGNVAPLTERTLFVDLNNPTGSLGVFPPRPNTRGFYRQPRENMVSAQDTPAGSGADSATYQIDGGPVNNYLGSVPVGHGAHSFTARARDRAGRQSASFGSSFSVDQHAPVPLIETPAPGILIAPGTVTLRYSVSDAFTPKSRVSISIFDELETFVRRIDVPGPTPADPYKPHGSGSVTWDGRNNANDGVLPGIYHYRVQATDEAGNTAISTDSGTFLVLLPPITILEREAQRSEAPETVTVSSVAPASGPAAPPTAAGAAPVRAAARPAGVARKRVTRAQRSKAACLRRAARRKGAKARRAAERACRRAALHRG